MIPVLHHYPSSPFAEKIRKLLAYKQVDYREVIIPRYLPKPLLMPLTGGYRKTPVLQIGADVYCDTTVIAIELEKRFPEPGVFPAGSQLANEVLTSWIDDYVFRICVGISFHPKVQKTDQAMTAEEKADFANDRAEMLKGVDYAVPTRMGKPMLHHFLVNMTDQLSERSFLLGSRPVVADFSAYMCMWQLMRYPVLMELTEPYPAVRDWYQRMSEIEGGSVTTISGEAALEYAAKAAPVELRVEPVPSDIFKHGDEVLISPSDFGDPVAGVLVASTLERFVITRRDSSLGDVHIHFPRLKYRIDSRRQASG